MTTGMPVVMLTSQVAREVKPYGHSDRLHPAFTATGGGSLGPRLCNRARGARRVLSDQEAIAPGCRRPVVYGSSFRYNREPELFALELDTLARVREETPNLHLMIPFVHTRWERA
jgi:hypothetical protein